jgi:hypothetical protein
MAKATNPRKPAGDKRKSGAAAKRNARKRPTQALKVSAKPARPVAARVIGLPRGAERLDPPPAGKQGDARATAAQVAVLAPPPAPEPPRAPPPLPVPIASFTF